MSKTMAYKVVEDVLVVVHTRNPPADEEWTPFVQIHGLSTTERCLVLTLGGGPNSRQRSQLVNELRERPVPTTVLTDSVVVRGIVTALSWLGHQTRAYPTRQFREAVRRLDRSHLEEALTKALLELQGELGLWNASVTTSAPP